jgi:hypothetical protein
MFNFYFFTSRHFFSRFFCKIYFRTAYDMLFDSQASPWDEFVAYLQGLHVLLDDIVATDDDSITALLSEIDGKSAAWKAAVKGRLNTLRAARGAAASSAVSTTLATASAAAAAGSHRNIAASLNAASPGAGATASTTRVAPSPNNAENDDFCTEHDVSCVNHLWRCGVCGRESGHPRCADFAGPPQQKIQRMCTNKMCQKLVDAMDGVRWCPQCLTVFHEFVQLDPHMATLHHVDALVTRINAMRSKGERSNVKRDLEKSRMRDLMGALSARTYRGSACSLLPMEFHGQLVLEALEMLRCENLARSPFLSKLTAVVHRAFNRADRGAWERSSAEYAEGASMRSAFALHVCTTLEQQRREQAAGITRTPKTVSAKDQQLEARKYAEVIVNKLLQELTERMTQKRAANAEQQQHYLVNVPADVRSFLDLRSYYVAKNSGPTVLAATSTVELINALLACGALHCVGANNKPAVANPRQC